jgi:hypothetical protein
MFQEFGMLGSNKIEKKTLMYEIIEEKGFP